LKPQIVHWKKSPYDVYIGRPSRWGNPFSSKAGIAEYRVANKSEALRKHREWILGNTQLIQDIKRELRDKTLGCWCDSPYACHGLILWQIANDITPDTGITPAIQPTLF
jgi:hypothetical protein